MERDELLQSLKKRGFSKEILDAFSKVKREDFIPKESRIFAYEDTSLPIGEGQSISQPYTIATMLSMLKLETGMKVLEIGSGSGYVLALMSKVVGSKGKAFGLEIRKQLVQQSKTSLKDYKNVEVFYAHGKAGLKQKAPFDRIIISAAASEIPKKIVPQLKEKGIIAAPLGRPYEFSQSLVSYEKVKGKLILKEKHDGFLFVPLID
ncbi:protein-L-isoaspartate O-methyltransferase [Candidatus Pacearchaeota archaeon]|nr:protein-L-isoaspartate O-methyltransferase [Candidatus Pacearchaeota archaeon]